MRPSNDLRRLRFFKQSLVVGGLLVGALCSSQVSAAVAVQKGGFDKFMSTVTGTGQQTIGFGAGGQPITATKYSTGSALGNMGTFQDPAGNGLLVKGTAKVPMGTSGKVADVAVEGKITPQSFTKALTGLLPLVGGWPGLVIAGGIALADWMQAANISYDSTGFHQTNPSYTCPVADQRMPGLDGTCNANVAGSLAWGIKVDNMAAVPPQCRLVLHCKYGANGDYNANFTVSGPYNLTQGSTVVNVTEQQALTALQSAQVPPDLAATLSGLGAPLDVETPTITGPSFVPGPVSTSTTPQVGSTPSKTVVDTTNWNCTYAGDVQTCTQTSTRTESTFDSSTPGATTQTSVTTTQKEEAPKEADPCIAHPERNGCREDKFDVPTDQVPKKTVTITWAEENLGFGAGACPAPFTFHSSIGDYALNLADYCSAIVTYVKPLVLLFSLLAAFFIIAPIKDSL